MPWLWFDAKTQVGRLLRVLLVWIGALSADANRSRGRRIGNGLLPDVSDSKSFEPQADWLGRPGAALIWWCAPLGVALTITVAISSARIFACVWVVALGWMGIGCWLNARRCHRLHCYLSAPILLLGALVAGLIGFDVVTLGPHALNNAISLTLALALLSFVPEMIWGRYGRSRAVNR
jgi:hypothetical protein